MLFKKIGYKFTPYFKETLVQQLMCVFEDVEFVEQCEIETFKKICTMMVDVILLTGC